MYTLALIHSPLVGPLTWSLVGDELRRRNIDARLIELRQPADDATSFYQQLARSGAEALRATPADRELILVGHSGAGALLPLIRRGAQRSAAAYVFVDAGPPRGGQAIIDEPDFGPYLRELYARGERFPNWTDAALRDILPDPALRQQLLRELRPQPLAFWTEPQPASADWPDAPCAFLHFSAAYDAPAAEARAAGWPYLRVEGGHFHMLVEPAAVADALLDLVRQLRHDLSPAPPD